MDPLTGVATAALVEGVKFLYQQAAEVLSAWRARRRDRQAPPPNVVEPPGAVHVERLRPLPDPTSPEMADTLQELKDLVEPIKDGEVDPETIAARQAVARLRELLEVIVGSPITFAGEPPRTVAVSDVDVVVQRVAGQVVGVRADLAKLQGPAFIRSGPSARGRRGQWWCGDRRRPDLTVPVDLRPRSCSSRNLTGPMSRSGRRISPAEAGCSPALTSSSTGRQGCFSCSASRARARPRLRHSLPWPRLVGSPRPQRRLRHVGPCRLPLPTSAARVRVDLLDVAQRLSDQLAEAIPGFAHARQATLLPEIHVGDVQVHTGDIAAGGSATGVRIDLSRLQAENGAEAAFVQGVTLPLKRVREAGESTQVVLLVDALDESLASQTAKELPRLLGDVEHAHLVVTARPDRRAIQLVAGSRRACGPAC